MTTETLRVLTGTWFDSDGFISEQGAQFPVFIAGAKIKDDLHLTWSVNGNGDLVSAQSVAYFSPDAGELARVGLA